MFRRIVFSAAVSGLVTGLLITVMQMLTVVPMILEAETREAPATQVDEPAQAGTPGSSAAPEEEWAPQEGVERTFYTTLTNTLAAIGFALLLGACYSLLGSIDWRKGLLWGLAGFAAFQLAPAIGLPPELPGTVAAALSERQVWWIATAILTAVGLGLMVYSKEMTVKAVGLIVIVIPHAVGTPRPFVHATIVPEALATEFIITTMFVGAAFWLLLGALTGYTFNKFK